MVRAALTALASTALRMKRSPFSTAAQALEDIAPPLRQTAAYQRAAGVLALQRGDRQAAERDFAEALRLAPDDPVNRLSLAVRQLQSTNLDISRDARKTPERLTMDSQMGLLAARPPVTASTDRRDFEGAEQLSLQVLTNAHCTFRDYAALSLLLDNDVTQAHQLAAEVYRVEPKNPFYASTYAFSLHKQGRAREAVAVLRKLNAEQLDNPVIAVYYGIMLAAVGEAAEAGPYLSKSSQARLMPEELALVDRAKTGL